MYKLWKMLIFLWAWISVDMRSTKNLARGRGVVSGSHCLNKTAGVWKQLCGEKQTHYKTKMLRISFITEYSTHGSWWSRWAQMESNDPKRDRNGLRTIRFFLVRFVFSWYVPKRKGLIYLTISQTTQRCPAGRPAKIFGFLLYNVIYVLVVNILAFKKIVNVKRDQNSLYMYIKWWQ